jgi:hypothetical protein
MRLAGHVARLEKRTAYRILMGKSEGKRPLGRHRRRWVDNIKIDLREIGWDGMVWYGLDRSDSGEGPVEGSCEHGNEPSGSINCWEVLQWLHNWRILNKGSAPYVKYTVDRTSWTGDQPVAKEE